MAYQFADATEVVTTWLISQQDLPVRWAVPTDRPNEFLVVRRTGMGAPSRWKDTALIDVECWSGPPNSSPKPAAALAARIRRHLEDMPDGPNRVQDVTITGMASLPDPVSRCPRVVIGCQVLIRAS